MDFDVGFDDKENIPPPEGDSPPSSSGTSASAAATQRHHRRSSGSGPLQSLVGSPRMVGACTQVADVGIQVHVEGGKVRVGLVFWGLRGKPRVNSIRGGGCVGTGWATVKSAYAQGRERLAIPLASTMSDLALGAPVWLAPAHSCLLFWKSWATSYGINTSPMKGKTQEQGCRGEGKGCGLLLTEESIRGRGGRLANCMKDMWLLQHRILLLTIHCYVYKIATIEVTVGSRKMFAGSLASKSLRALRKVLRPT
eukprot:1160035-Pelagomonas_calceolata.AAC.4